MIPRHIPGAIKTATYEYSNLYYYRGTGSPVIDLFVRAHVRDNKRRNGVMITRIKAEISLSSSPNPLPSSKRVVGERLIFIRPRPHHGTRYLSRTTTTSGLQGSSSAVQTPQARLQLPSLGVRARVPNERTRISPFSAYFPSFVALRFVGRGRDDGGSQGERR